ncbi:hypothetical protein [Streptomyces sp. NPDC026673]|uniref:hypothetical protein n=1 Tax=Streptomyces sp. NPDC026673 TaxID=3155724 RepID=UPI0033FDCCBF
MDADGRDGPARGAVAAGHPARAAGDVDDAGLLTEEADPAGGEPLGDFPRACSRIGPVNAAWAISEARQPVAAGPDLS